jgi:hypothetical protein
MRLFKIDGREIRSFKLQQQLLKLRQFFDKPNMFGLFMMNDLLQPEDRTVKRASYNIHNLKVEKLPKKVGRYLTQHKDWAGVAKLLSGNVVFIKHTEASQALPRETLKFLMNTERYSLRFLFWNQSFYRAKVMQTLNVALTEDLTPDLKLMYQMLRVSLNPFLKKTKLFHIKSFELSALKKDQVNLKVVDKASIYNTFSS